MLEMLSSCFCNHRLSRVGIQWSTCLLAMLEAERLKTTSTSISFPGSRLAQNQIGLTLKICISQCRSRVPLSGDTKFVRDIFSNNCYFEPSKLYQIFQSFFQYYIFIKSVYNLYHSKEKSSDILCVLFLDYNYDICRSSASLFNMGSIRPCWEAVFRRSPSRLFHFDRYF